MVLFPVEEKPSMAIVIFELIGELILNDGKDTDISWQKKTIPPKNQNISTPTNLLSTQKLTKRLTIRTL